MNHTTDLNVIRYHPNAYTWGKVKDIHVIGPYTVVEFNPWKTDNGRVTHTTDGSVTNFSCYLDGKDLRCSYDTLELAITQCIAIKYEGPNTRAGIYFNKMVGAVVNE